MDFYIEKLITTTKAVKERISFKELRKTLCWINANGDSISINKLNDYHLVNIKHFLKRYRHSFNGKYQGIDKDIWVDIIQTEIDYRDDKRQFDKYKLKLKSYE